MVRSFVRPSVWSSFVRAAVCRIHSVRFGQPLRQFTLTVHINTLYNERVHGKEEQLLDLLCYMELKPGPRPNDRNQGLRWTRWGCWGGCGVTRKDKIRNEHIRGTTKVAQASRKITERRLKWYGHVIRMEEDHVVKRVMTKAIPGKRKRGRPKTRWKDVCKRDMQNVGLREGDEGDRAYWKETINNHSGDPRWREKPEEKKKTWKGRTCNLN